MGARLDRVRFQSDVDPGSTEFQSLVHSVIPGREPRLSPNPEE